MYKITIRMSYPWEAEWPEHEEVWFILSGEYPCSSAEEVREVVMKLISLGSPTDDPDRPGWVLDADGDLWPFYPETVGEVRVEEVDVGFTSDLTCPTPRGS